MTEQQKPVLAVVGPTASGKTALGVQLAKCYQGEVVSADSMQIYQGLDLATAKPTEEEMQGVPHHLISQIPRETPFSVADYVALAKQTIAQVHARGHLPILVGGTGLYVSSLLDNVQFPTWKGDPGLREALTQFAAEHGAEALHARLRELDPEAADAIHPNNVVRVVRAIEVCQCSGTTFTKQKQENRSHLPLYRSFIIGLDYADRAQLYQRIDRRVEQMVEQGLVEEVRAVYQAAPKTAHTAGYAIGYKELLPYLDGTSDLESCIARIQQETRHYAKRQLTWFRKNPAISWIILDKLDNKYEILEKCKKMIAKSQLL